MKHPTYEQLFENKIFIQECKNKSTQELRNLSASGLKGKKYKIVQNELYDRKKRKQEYNSYQKLKELFCFTFDNQFKILQKTDLIPLGKINYQTEFKNIKKIPTKKGKYYTNKYRTNSKYRYYMYKRTAKDKKLPFSLSLLDCIDLFNKSCWYCGYKPLDNSLNGIDRVDSSRGYVKDNVVSCCKHCNYMKGSIESKFKVTQEEYLNQIFKIHKHQIQKIS